MTTTQDTTIDTPAQDTAAKQTLFKVGWSYDVFLRKNSLPPSPQASETWRTLSQEHSKAQLESMRELANMGAKVVCKAKAVYNAKDGRFDTSLTARVIKPGCKDQDMILEAVQSAHKRASKRLSDMRSAAAGMGVIVG